MRTFLRRWRSNPLATALLVVVTACAAGAMGAAFLLLDAVLWRPLPGIPDARDVAVISFPGANGLDQSVPLAYFDDLRSAAGAGDWCPFSYGSQSRVTHAGTRQSRVVTYWMPTCGQVFRVNPILGRFWSDDPVTAHRAVVISERYWERDFGRDPAVIGTSLVMDDLPVVIIGVAPASFMGLSVEIAPDLFVPLTVDTGQLTSNGRPVTFRHLVGRPDPHDASTVPQRVGDRLTVLLAAGSISLTPAHRAALERSTVDMDTTGRGKSYLRDGYAEPVQTLAFVCLLLLLMAAVNVSAVVFAQTRWREREFVVRTFLGASTAHKLRLLFVEVAGPIGVGLGLAIPIAVFLSRVMAQSLWTSATPSSIIINVSWQALGVFVVLASLLAACAIGAALWASASFGRHGGPGAGAARQTRVGSALAASQCAASLAILFVAALLVSGMADLNRADLGFYRSQLTFVRLLPGAQGLQPDDQHQHYANLVEEARRLPGVASVALASAFPNEGRLLVRLSGQDDQVTVSTDLVSDEFFATTGLQVRMGRTFGELDTPQATRVAVVTEGLAATMFPGGDVLGRQILFGTPELAYTVVGVVGDVRLAGARLPAVPTVYRARRQQPNLNPMFIVRTSGPSVAMTKPLSDLIQRLGRDYPVGLSSMEDHLARNLAPERTLSLLAWILGGLVLLLGGIGLLSQQTTWALGERRSTVLRMVLGESPHSVITRLVRRAALIVVVGSACGVPLAIGGAYMLRSVLPGFEPDKPGLLLWTLLFVLVTATLVSYLPTRFLSRLRPDEVLRSER
jgi:predicted permease